MVRVLTYGSVVAVAVVLWRHKVRDFPPRLRRLVDVAEVVGLVILTGYVILTAYRGVIEPRAWDFPVFYTVGRNALEGLSFYDPQSLLPTFLSIQREVLVPSDWLQEFGFWYAPPSALLLAPLGMFDYQTGLIVQLTSQGALFVGSVYLLDRYFPLRSGAMGLVDMALICLAFRPVLSAFELAQIVFGAFILLVVATWSIRDMPWIAGLSLGVGSLFKHLLLIPAALSLVIRRWKTAVGSLFAVLVAGLIAGLTFGFDAFVEFLEFGPSDRAAGLASDGVIESLNAVLRRALHDVPAGDGALEAILYPPYLVAAFALTLITIVIARRAEKNHDESRLAFALITLLSLIVYPNTLYNTLPLMLPPIMVILEGSHRLTFDPRLTVSVVVAAYAITAFRGISAFWALLIVWGYLAACLLSVDRRTTRAASMNSPEPTAV
jgi:hypothetical protein